MKGAAAILAGGMSRRMGRPKAWLPFAGKPLVVHLAERLSAVFERVVVVAADPANAERLAGELPAGAEATADVIPERGPLGGLHAGMVYAAAPCVFVVACDYPFVQPVLGTALVRLLHEPGPDGTPHQAAVPLLAGGPQPLAAAYARTCLPVLDKLLAAGEAGRGPSVADLLARVRVRYVPVEALRHAGDPELLLFNMNTPDDYLRALALWPSVGC